MYRFDIYVSRAPVANAITYEELCEHLLGLAEELVNAEGHTLELEIKRVWKQDPPRPELSLGLLEQAVEVVDELKKQE